MDTRKPLTIANVEFRTAMVELINSSELPYFVIESALKDCLSEIHRASIEQLKLDEAEYKARIAQADK